MLLLPCAGLLLLARPAAQSAEPPFRFDLPAGYGAFVEQTEQPGWWIASAVEPPAAFTVRHQFVEAAGADPVRFAEWRRRDYWEPALAGASPRLEAWQGTLGGGPAAGSIVRFRLREREHVVIERFQIHYDHLIALTWEGPPEAAADANARLDRFVPPASWRPPPLASDLGRGGGPAPLPPLGHFEVTLDAAREAGAALEVTLLFQAAPWLAERGRLRWRVPGAAEPVELELDRGACKLVYTLRHDGDPGLAAAFGLAIDGLDLAACQASGWLAAPLLPELDAEPQRPVTPPSWRLEARVPAHLRALAAAAPAEERLDAASGARVFQFPRVAPGAGWPFVVVGQFAPVEIAGLRFWRRSGAKARDADAPLRFLARAAAALAARLPAAAALRWEVASFPGAGDRVLPGLLLLEERRGWLSQPLDQADPAAAAGSSSALVTRRRGLAELAVARAFGLELRGAGSGAPFLEASLTAWLAGELLADLGFVAEAEAIAAAWEAHDDAAGPLPAPLSLLPRADLAGAQRLLDRGPRVWQALAGRGGRQQLDAVLDEALKRGGFWTTEDLRVALEHATGADWAGFFERHVYGREALPAD